VSARLALWVCADCGAAYQLQLFTCVRCRSNRVVHGRDPMLKECANCSTRCAADLPACPHCQSTDLHEEGEMPKIDRHGNVTNAGDDLNVMREHPGTGVEMEAVEMTVDEDGVAHGEIDNDGSGVTLPPVDEDEEAEGVPADNDVEPEAEPVDSAPSRPATNATKGDWLTYARAVTGEDIEDSDYTKAELIELVNGLA
jgi:DNA-directed RNA polymerase subunit RPC12/RpoP